MSTTVDLKLHKQYAAEQRNLKGIADFTADDIERVRQYLLPYQTENVSEPSGAAAFQNRQARLYNEDIVTPYLVIHVGFMSQDIDFTKVPTGGVWDEIMKDVTQFEDTPKEFARKLLFQYCRDGRVGILVDRDAQKSPSEAEARSNGERSYQVMYESKDILDWKRFGKGKFKGRLSRVLLCDGIVEIGNKERQQLREITMNDVGIVSVQLYHVDPDAAWTGGSVKAEPFGAPITIGITEQIPFVLIGEGYSDSLVGSGWQTNAALLNRLSARDSANYSQGFQRNFAAGVKPEEVSKIGENVLAILSNENAKVFSLQAGNPEALVVQGTELRWYARRKQMFEYNQLADDTKGIQSADSKERDSKARKELYDTILDLLDAKISLAFQLMALFEGKTPEEASKIVVSTLRDYGLQDLIQEAAERQQTYSMATDLSVIGVKKRILKAAVSRIKFVPENGKTEEQIRAEIYKEIDEASGESLLLRRTFTGISALGKPETSQLIKNADAGAQQAAA